MKLPPSTKLGIGRNEPQRNAKRSHSGNTSVNPNYKGKHYNPKYSNSKTIQQKTRIQTETR